MLIRTLPKLWFLATLVTLVSATRATATNYEDCFQTADPDLAIRGCTNFIGWTKGGNLQAAYMNRGNAYYSKGDYDLAIADYDAGLKIRPDHWLYHRRADAYAAKGELDRAIADYNRAINDVPKFADAYYGRGIAHLRTGNRSRALDDFQTVVRLTSASPPIVPTLTPSDQLNADAHARIAEIEGNTSPSSLPPVVVAPSLSGQPPAAANNTNELNNIAFLQYLLIWTGDYVGIVDGIGGPLTENAIRQYEARSARQSVRPPPGSAPPPDSAEALIRDAVEALLVFDFVLLRDNEIGVVYGVPRSIFQPPRKINRRNTIGLSFSSPDGSVDLEVMRLTNREDSLTDLFNRLSRLKNRNVTYQVLKGSWFVISGTEGSRNFYARFESGGGDIRGFSFSYERRWSEDLGRVAVAMSNVFRPTADANDPLIAFVEGLQAEMERAASGAEEGKPPKAEESSGSGFVVDDDGHIVSNAHVVENCHEIRIGEDGIGRLVAADQDNDLALLESSATHGSSGLVFRSDTIKLGEEVIAAGYPLHGILADSLNITVGVVSSLSGLGNDRRFLQTTAAIQPGNSGGPLVDRNGRVVGIVTAKLRAQEMLAITGVVPEGVNFAIRHGQVRSFLQAQGVEPKVSSDILEPRSVQEVAEVLQKSVVPVICIAN